MRPALFMLAATIVAGVAAGWWLTRPQPLAVDRLAGLEGDAARGATLFVAAGCESCHIAPDAPDEDGPPILAGGQAFETAFGTFHAPNISPGLEGIGDWSDTELVSAMATGVGRGVHLYPAFPYTSYENAEPQDLLDIAAFMRTLPVSDATSIPHDMPFPFNIRRGLGVWKLVNANRGWVLEEPESEAVERGRYLVEALYHCGQCHTPRGPLGGLDRTRWLQGGENPDGEGRIPGIAPGQLDWSDNDLVAFLKTGLTPEYDSAGGNMVEVIENTGVLPDEDVAAIVAYLRAIPAAKEAG